MVLGIVTKALKGMEGRYLWQSCGFLNFTIFLGCMFLLQTLLSTSRCLFLRDGLLTARRGIHHCPLLKVGGSRVVPEMFIPGLYWSWSSSLTWFPSSVCSPCPSPSFFSKIKPVSDKLSWVSGSLLWVKTVSFLGEFGLCQRMILTWIFQQTSSFFFFYTL